MMLHHRTVRPAHRSWPPFDHSRCIIYIVWHLTSLVATAFAVIVTTGRTSSSDAAYHPLLSQPMCLVWTDSSIDDLCQLAPWSRVQLMRRLSLFQRDCDHAEANVQLAALFRLDFTGIGVDSQMDLRSVVSHLRAADCVTAEAGSGECRRCFGRIGRVLADVARLYAAFDATLHRFDCTRAAATVDSSLRTRPFSPNASCVDCKMWYRKWLLVEMANLWKNPACSSWCDYVQLACPHLATSKAVDYAGHPSFQCRDLHISHTTSSSSTADDYQCQCVHPCDLHLYSSSSSSVDNDDGDGISTDYRSDYWWFLTADNIINCADRQRKCSRQSTASSMRTTKRKKKRRRRRAKDDDERSSGANGIHHHRLVPSSIIDNRHHTTTISWLQLPLFLSFFISLARIVVAD